MTLGEARAEADRRWRPHGGWAEEEWITMWVEGGEKGEWARRVGYRVNDGHGSRQVCMGSGKTWDIAFSKAVERESKIEKERSRLRPGDIAVQKGGFPTVEMFE